MCRNNFHLQLRLTRIGLILSAGAVATSGNPDQSAWPQPGDGDDAVLAQGGRPALDSTRSPRATLREAALTLAIGSDLSRQLLQEPGGQAEEEEESLPAQSPQRQLLLNHGDVQYVAQLSVGRQPVSGIVDTGSFELVVFPKHCTSCGRAARYDPALSRTRSEGRLTTKHNYGCGDAESADAADMVSVGPLVEKRQAFWEVSSARMPLLQHSTFEAIIGLGPPEVPPADAWNSVRKVVQNISQRLERGRYEVTDLMQGVRDATAVALDIAERPGLLSTFHVGAFAICLGAAPGSDGYITWHDQSAAAAPGLFTRVPVVGPQGWMVEARNVSLLARSGAEHLVLGCEAGCPALVDTGTSLLAVPSNVIAMLEELLSHMDVNCSSLAKLPELAFELGGESFSLPADAFVAQALDSAPSYLQSLARLREVEVGSGTGGPLCQLLLLESPGEVQGQPLWILGLPFFRKYYAGFHTGARRAERAIYVASASDECEPRPRAKASRDRAAPHARSITPSRVYMSRTG